MASSTKFFRRFGWLVAFVFAIHLIVLSRAASEMAVDHAPPLKTLVTRSIPPPPPAPTAVAMPQSAPVEIVRPPVAPPARVVAPKNPVAGQPARPSEPPPEAGQIAQNDPPAKPPDLPASAPRIEPPQLPQLPPPPPPVPAAVAAAPVNIPGSTKLVYQVQGEAKRMSYNASANLDWMQDGSRYDLKYRVGAFLLGERVQTSFGKVSDKGLEPERFSDRSRTEIATHFDREKNLVIFSANAPSQPLTPGAQDRLSLFMQLSSLLAGLGNKATPSATLSMQIVSGRDSDVWTFNISDPEMLSLPVGEVRAIKVTRKPRREFDQTAELWFAPEMGYLPVRLKITESNGDFVDQKLKSVTNP